MPEPKRNVLDLLSDDHLKRLNFMINALVEHGVETATPEDLEYYARWFQRQHYESDNVSAKDIPKNRAVFKITSVPSWAAGILVEGRPAVAVGDICYSITGTQRHYSVFNVRTKQKQGGLFDHLEFIRYEPDV